MKSFFIFLLTVLTGSFTAQVKLIVTVPSTTPENTKIYMASSLNSWDPTDSGFELKKTTAGKYELHIPENSGKVEYKFTQGSWETAEGNESGKGIENRTFTFTGTPQIIENTILSWPKPEPKKHTASKNVKILSENFPVPQLGTTRKIWIYLPEDYQSSQKKYPVIYMHDGQNLFDDLTSFSGEWKIDETMDHFFKEGKKQAIIIGIDNGGSERLNEYSPWENSEYGGGKGDLYADFLAQTLKPYIDKNYRTLSSAKNTGLVGSSMGGLISFYTGMKYPEKFGKLGVFSPSFWFAREDLTHYISKHSKSLKKTKIYLVAGRKESEEMVTDIEKITPILISKGICRKNIVTKFDDYGTHSESYWAKEFPAAYLWLFN